MLSGLLTCEECGGTIRVVNGREFGCATYRDGGTAACTNGVRVRIDVAEQKLLNELAEEMLSPEGIALLEKRVREHLREQAFAPQVPSKPQAAQVAKKAAEIDQLRALMKAGTLSQAVAQAAIEQAEAELAAFEQIAPRREEKQTARILRMLPRAAEVLRDRVRAGNAGLRDPRSIIQGRNALFGMFGGRIPLRPGSPKAGERPFLIARVGLNHGVLLEAAASAVGCVKTGSGGVLWNLFASDAPLKKTY